MNWYIEKKRIQKKVGRCIAKQIATGNGDFKNNQPARLTIIKCIWDSLPTSPMSPNFDNYMVSIFRIHLLEFGIMKRRIYAH